MLAGNIGISNNIYELRGGGYCILVGSSGKLNDGGGAYGNDGNDMY